MSRPRRLRRTAGLCVGLCVAVAVAAGPVPARAASAAVEGPVVVGDGPQAAALVIDDGTVVRTVCVRFTEASLTGAELLRRAEVEAVLRGFGGLGVAVCSLCGTGCPADGSCLTCAGDTHWSYHRAPAGSGDWVTSPVGAGATKVTDGSVEAWAWGEGEPPGFVPFTQVCLGQDATGAVTSAAITTVGAPGVSTAPDVSTAPATGPTGPAATPAPSGTAAPATVVATTAAVALGTSSAATTGPTSAAASSAGAAPAASSAPAVAGDPSDTGGGGTSGAVTLLVVGVAATCFGAVAWRLRGERAARGRARPEG